MGVWFEENGKEANSKCGKIASSLIVRHTILGGIGVIQHVLKHQSYLMMMIVNVNTYSSRASVQPGRRREGALSSEFENFNVLPAFPRRTWEQLPHHPRRNERGVFFCESM